MAKSIRGILPPDDPIFSEGPQAFVPVSRPSTKSSASDTDGETSTNPDSVEARMKSADESMRQAASEGMLAQASPSTDEDESPSLTGDEEKY